MERDLLGIGISRHTIDLQERQTEQSESEQQKSSLGDAGAWRSCRGRQEKGRGVVRRMRVTRWILWEEACCAKTLANLLLAKRADKATPVRQRGWQRICIFVDSWQVGQ